MWKLLITLSTVYLSVLVVIWAGQTAAIFPAGSVGSAGPLPPGAVRLVETAESGEKLHGIHIPPATQSSDAPLLLVFAGNAWNAEDAAKYVHDLMPQADVVAFHYRGYRPSEGRPSAAALQADSLRIHDHVVRRFPGRPVVAAGFSIGSGVAAHLASRRPLAGVVLVTPFESLGEVAHGHYPWLPARLLLRHPMEPARELRNSRTPVAVIAAAGDTLIPPVHAQRLRQAIPNVVLARTIEGAGHNDIYQSPAFRTAFAQAVERIKRVR